MKKIFFLITLLSTVTLIGCSSFFQSKVPMDFDASGAYLEDLLVEKKVGGKLQTPTEINISKNLTKDAITINWNPVKNAVSYRIEYAIISQNMEGKYPEIIEDAEFNVLEPAWYSTNYVHEIKFSNMKDYQNRYNKRFYYRVTAMNEREGYEESLPTPSNIYGTLFAPVQNVQATGGASEDYIRVEWDKVLGADYYEIYRSQSETGSGAVKLDEVFGNLNFYRDENFQPIDKGKPFYYKVIAINRNGNKSDDSAIAMGYTLMPGAPAQPKNLTLIKGRGESINEIGLKWDPVISSEGTVKYDIYRTSGGSQVKFKGIEDTKFTDNRNLEIGKFYEYTITAYVENSLGEVLLSPKSTSIEGFILSPPPTVDVIKVDVGNKLVWETPIGSENEQKTYKYQILASKTKDGPFQEISVVTGNEVVVESFGFYQIQTINKDGLKSKESETVAPPPSEPSDITISRADYSFVIDGNLKANDFGVYPVQITWKKPVDDTPSGYYVYRSLNEEKGYRKISDEPIKTTSYIDMDSTLQPSKVYYYKVVSLNVFDKGNNYSKPDYGWGALTHERYLKEFNKTIISSQKKLTLMHKPGSTDKLGSESKQGTISGSVSYNAAVAGLGAEITMRYTNYADFYIKPDKPEMGLMFNLNGNSDTSANMSSNGTMHGTISCTGMYPGTVDYGKIEIKAGAAGGGTYGVTPKGATPKDIHFAVLEEK